MENVPLPEFQYELSQRDGIRKFHYKPPDTVGDLTKAFPFMAAMNNCSPKLNVIRIVICVRGMLNSFCI